MRTTTEQVTIVRVPRGVRMESLRGVWGMLSVARRGVALRSTQGPPPFDPDIPPATNRPKHRGAASAVHDPAALRDRRWLPFRYFAVIAAVPIATRDQSWADSL